MNFEQKIEIVYVLQGQTPSNYINERQLLGWELVSSSSVTEDDQQKFTLTFKRDKSLKSYFRFNDLNKKIDYIDSIKKDVMVEGIERYYKKERSIIVQSNLSIIVMVLLIFLDLFFIVGLITTDKIGFNEVVSIFINSIFMIGLNVGFVYWFKYIIREKKKTTKDPIIDMLNQARKHFFSEAEKLNFDKK